MKKLITVSLISLGLMSVSSFVLADSLTPAGTAIFKNGVRIPAYTVNYQIDGGMTTSEESCYGNACNFQFTIPNEQAASLKLLKLYYLSWVLVPKEAKITRAEVGANGSAVLEIKSGRADIVEYDSSACVGCAYWSAFPYFDNARKLAKESFPNTESSNPRKGLKSVRKDYTTAFYSYPSNSKMTHGVAKFFDGSKNEDVGFNNLEVTVDKRNTRLATTILNFYYHQNRSQTPTW